MDKIKAIEEYNSKIKRVLISEEEIKAAINKLSPVEKKEMQGTLTAAGLPTAYTKESNVDTLAKILSIVAPK